MRLAKRNSIWISLAFLCAPAVAQTTRAISVGRGGGQSNGESGAQTYLPSGALQQDWGASISSDGRYFIFASLASNLVPEDSNGTWDIFRFDRTTGDVTRVSVAPNGDQADNASVYPSMSADDRYVAFESAADNLVSGDTNGVADVFVKDLQTGTVTIASVDSNGVPANGWSGFPMLSANGRMVAFRSVATNLVPVAPSTNGHLFVHDLQTGTTALVDVSTSGAVADDAEEEEFPSISADGRYVAFSSSATNLVAGDTNGYQDAFVRDLQAGTTVRVGEVANFATIAAGGRYVVYDSYGAQIYVHDLQTGTDTLASIDLDGSVLGNWNLMAELSADGRYVAFAHWDYDPFDADLAQVYVRDLQAGRSYAISTDPSGASWGDRVSFVDWNLSSFSSDDHELVFMSNATNLVAGDTNGGFDVYVHDLQLGTNTRVSVSGAGLPASGGSYAPSLSADGRFAAFESTAADIVAGDTNGMVDVFVFDRQAGTTVRASVASNDAQGDGVSVSPSISSDGRFVAFASSATTLVPGDTNLQEDVFVRDLQLGTTERVDVSSSGVEANGWCAAPSISADGRYVAFFGIATNLVAGDTNNAADIFVRDRSTGTTQRVSVDSSGNQANSSSSYPAISADGRYVAFSTDASNLVPNDTNGTFDVFVHDRQTGATSLVSVGMSGSPGNHASQLPAISADGRYIAFISVASDLVPGDTNASYDVFVRDMVAGVTTRVDVASNGAEASGTDFTENLVRISADGRYVAFDSSAVNLVAGDTNAWPDAFLHDRLTGVTERVSVSFSGAQGDGPSGNQGLSMSADGRLVAFASYSGNLVTGDNNVNWDVFLRDRGDEAVFAPFCFGDGTIVACPCGNSGSPGHGCQNSAGTGGAVLTGSGVPSLSADTVHLSSSGELPSVTSILLQGTAISAPTIFGDGRRCAGGTLKRLYPVSAVGGVATAPQGTQLSISARSAALGSPIASGSTRIYQMYYRDPSSSFCPNPPGNLYNISSAVAITWTN